MPIDLIDTIKPKNNGTFPMVEAEDVVVGKGTADEKRLPEALAEAGKVAAVDTAMPSSPADDHVPSTQLLKEELAKKLSLTGGTLSGTLTVNASVAASSFKIPQDSVPQGSVPHAGSIISIPNGSQLAGAVGIVYERIGNNPSGYTRKRFMGVSGGDYDTRLYIGDGNTPNADSGLTTVFGLHLPDDRTWARHDLWFTDKFGDTQGARTWWGLVQDGDELRIVKDKGTPKAYLPLSGGTVTGNVTFNGTDNYMTSLRFGGTAAAAGLKTRGICGTIADGKTKGGLFLNYDGRLVPTSEYFSGSGEGRGVYIGGEPAQNGTGCLALRKMDGDYFYAPKSHQHAASDITGLPSGVAVDDALSNTSENPVQNKVVKAALDGKLSTTNPKLAMDSGLTFSSGNISTGTIHYATLALTESGTLVFIASNSAQYKNATLPLSAKSFSAETSFTIYVEGVPKTQLTSDYILEAGEKLQDKYAAKEHTHTDYATKDYVTGLVGDIQAALAAI